MVTEKEFRETLGRKAQRFVRQNWNRETVAKRFLDLIRGDYPDEWRCDPGQISYCHGAGMHEDVLKETVATLLASYGEKSLQLDSKPDLRNRLVAMSCQTR